MKFLLITKKHFRNGKPLTGFTIVELIVVMAVFLFIIGAAIGIFISIIQSQKRVLSEQQFLNQVSYAEEYMSKALRMAEKDTVGTCLVDNSATSINRDPHPDYNYLLTRPINGVFTGIKFIDASDGSSCDEFYLDMSSTPYVLEKTKNGGDPVPLTASDMKINYVRFGIDGSNGSVGSPMGDQDNIGGIDYSYFQPRVSVVMSIKIPGDDLEPTRIIQTTVSQRNLNVK